MPAKRTRSTPRRKGESKILKALPINFLEGTVDYSQAKPPYDDSEDPRVLGWNIGRQITAQYVIEMLLRYSLEKQSIQARNTHDLRYLFNKLPESKRNAVEDRYKVLLNSEVEWTWDVCKTVHSFLSFLGKNPIKNTRYPWQSSKDLLYNANMYRYLFYAIFIELHGYPTAEDSFEKRYETQFKSLADSRKYERFDENGKRRPVPRQERNA